MTRRLDFKHSSRNDDDDKGDNSVAKQIIKKKIKNINTYIYIYILNMYNAFVYNFGFLTWNDVLGDREITTLVIKKKKLRNVLKFTTTWTGCVCECVCVCRSW